MDVVDVSRIFFSFLAVLGLIGLAAIAARRMGLAAGAGGFKKARRLSVVETLPVDARRRVAIIRCDDREHLLILGQTGETLIAADLPQPEVKAQAVDDHGPAVLKTASRFIAPDTDKPSKVA